MSISRFPRAVLAFFAATLVLPLLPVAAADPPAAGRIDVPAPPPPPRAVQERLSTLPADEAAPRGPGSAVPAPMAKLEGEGPGPATVGVASTDNCGGDDKIVFSAEDVTNHDIDIASNGDIYVAVETVGGSFGEEIHVYRSQDGGDTWTQWGRIRYADADHTLHNPSILIAEGDIDYCFVAFTHRMTGRWQIEICRAPLTDSTATFEWFNVLADDTVSFIECDLASDAVAFNGYFLYLVASASDGGGNDIWFTRSLDMGETWEFPYRIGSLSLTDRNYRHPRICYGSGYYVHVAWYIQFYNGINDNAIRYRRAANFASGGITSWDPILAVTSASNGEQEQAPVIGASPTGNTVVIDYRRLIGSAGADAQIRSSTDMGATWPSGQVAEFPSNFVGLCRPVSGADWVIGANLSGESNRGFYRAPEADPLSLGACQVLSDENIYNATGFPVAIASDPTRGNRVAMVWTIQDQDGGSTDHLYFDAEWRGDPGYPNYDEGFPVVLASPASSPPAVVDVNAYPEPEIVFSDEAGDIQIYDHEGRRALGWPAHVGTRPQNAPVVVGDIDADGSPEIVAGTSDGRVFMLGPDGTVKSGFPVDLGTGADTYVAMGTFGTPFYRLIAAVSGRKLFVLNYRGDSVGNGYPVTFSTVHTVGPAIGDVDNDGVTEIVTSGANWVHVHSLASDIPEMYRNLGTEIANDAPTLADVDLDGDLEIAVPTRDGDVYLMHHDGTDFEATPPYSWPFTTASGSPVTSVAFANNLSTSPPELCFAARDYEVYLMFAYGKVHDAYPKATGTSWYLFGSPIVDGVNSNAGSVVIGSRDTHGWAWRNTGLATPGWPKELPGQCDVSPASGDIDLDGNNEFVFVTTTALAVVDVNYPPEENPLQRWPMYAHDPMRTGNLNGDVEVTAVPGGTPSDPARLAPPAPNPGTHGFRLAYTIPGRAAVRLDVYDARGRVVKHLFRAEQEEGSYTLRWDGADGGGLPVAGGIYFIRLEARGPGIEITETRKVTVMR
jgi:hypothetical protein